MFIKRVKPFLMALGISVISLGVSAGLALPAGAHRADIVAPTVVLSGTGALCPNMMTIATLLPGDALEGTVVVTSTGGPSTTNISDTNTGLSREFFGLTPQPFSILNNTATVDTIRACDRLAPLTAIIHANLIRAGSTSGNNVGTINIKVNASAINNNNSTNNITLLTKLYNLLYGMNKQHHYKHHKHYDDQDSHDNHNRHNNQ
ncbi:hypothetical protein KDA_27340 [Dictyobacter alpinus]|uniref:Uncharacterized protein n=1 Tax=Dictyobacter alpinus TaxID=2014873 RepID=A0A402B7H0_9CHLR|nr:hypothetical protein [Dictyobacter alpinus]GCE27250.1 hypothetical protein KDA_27340 [Dictyobacter alpinus]